MQPISDMANAFQDTKRPVKTFGEFGVCGLKGSLAVRLEPNENLISDIKVDVPTVRICCPFHCGLCLGEAMLKGRV